MLHNDEESALKPELIGLVDPRLKKRVDVFRLVLLHSASKTVLPELLETFGQEATIKFLDIFENQVVRVPGKDILTTAARDVDIYITTLKTRNSGQATKDLSSRYGLEEDAVRGIYKRVREIFRSEYGLRE